MAGSGAREEEGGPPCSPCLVLEGAVQLKEGCSRRGNSTSKGQGQCACECARKGWGWRRKDAPGGLERTWPVRGNDGLRAEGAFLSRPLNTHRHTHTRTHTHTPRTSDPKCKTSARSPPLFSREITTIQAGSRLPRLPVTWTPARVCRNGGADSPLPDRTPHSTGLLYARQR